MPRLDIIILWASGVAVTEIAKSTESGTFLCMCSYVLRQEDETADALGNTSSASRFHHRLINALIQLQVIAGGQYMQVGAIRIHSVMEGIWKSHLACCSVSAVRCLE